MGSFAKFRRPGYIPGGLHLHRRLRYFVAEQGMSILQLVEWGRSAQQRARILNKCRISEAELERDLRRIQELVKPHADALATVPFALPGFGGLRMPAKRGQRFKSIALNEFWKQRDYRLPRRFDHIPFFRDKCVIAQRGPDCVGHACRNAVEFYHRFPEKLSGLFAWQYAMEKEGYPIPPGGTWPSRVFEGSCERGICNEELHPEELYRDDEYAMPSADALSDASERRIETYLDLSHLIGRPDLPEIMCLLLHGDPEAGLPGRVLVLGLGVPEEWLTSEALITGLRPLPISAEPIGGHSFILLGYFVSDRLWFVGLENWGDRIGSQNPFDYPRDMGLVFIPEDFFKDPRWFWDLSIALSRNEAKIFGQTAEPFRPTLMARRSWIGRVNRVLATTAAIVALMRIAFPGNWW